MVHQNLIKSRRRIVRKYVELILAEYLFLCWIFQT